MESKEGPEKDADHSRLTGGSFSKQRNLHTGLIRRGHKMGKPLHLHTRILSLYTRSFSLSSVTYTIHMVSARHRSQGYVLERAPSRGTVARTNIPRMGVGEEPLIVQVQLADQPGVHVLSMSSSNMN